MKIEIFKRSKQNRANIVVNEIEKYTEQIKKEEKGVNSKEIANKVLGYLTENPELASEVLQGLIEKKEIPNTVFQETATQISRTKEIPDKVIPEAIENVNATVPAKVITGIIDEGKVNQEATITLIKNINDEKVQVEQVKQMLKELYQTCIKGLEFDLVEKLKKIDTICEKDSEIAKLQHKIIAKRMAYNYKQYGDSKIYTLSTYIPVEEMMEIDLPEMVETEYEKLLKRNEENKFNKSEFKIRILDYIAKHVVNSYNEIGEIIIPQSNSMAHLTNAEEKRFIEKIQIYSEKKLDKKQINNMKAQIRGRVNNIKLKEFLEKIRKLPQSEMNEFISRANSLLVDEEYFDTYRELQDTGTMETLKSVKKEKREKYIREINNIIYNREKQKKLHVATITPKIKEDNEEGIEK